MGAPRVTVEVAMERVKRVHGDVLTFDASTFTRVDRLCLFIDVEFGEWWALPNNVFKGHSHPRRGALKTSNKIKQKRGLTTDELQRRLDVIGLGVLVDVQTFNGSSKRCRFIDPLYGEWWATPSNVISRRTKHPERGRVDRKRTCLTRYGVDNPTKDPQIALRAALRQNVCFHKCHWKTGEILLCVCSYEAAVVEWLNVSQHDYEWQPGPFSMPDGRTYRPDALILSGPFVNTYVEVKGYFRDDAKEKWEWFHDAHPNSQLWDQARLRELGLLPKKRAKLRSE